MRRVPTLRVTLILILLGGGVYALGVGAFVAVMSQRASRATRQTETISQAFLHVTQRSAVVYDLVSQARVALSAEPVDRAAVADLARSVRTSAAGRRPIAMPEVPQSMLVALAEADYLISDLENLLLVILARAELGHGVAVRARLPEAERLEREVVTRLGQAQQVGLNDLTSRNMSVLGLTRVMVAGVGIWLVVWLVITPILIVIAQRRIQAPLSDVEAGLERVAAGDLAVRLPVRYEDELGRVAGHFNVMTAVLSKRAEQQGRLAAAGELVAGVAHEVNNPLMAIALLAESRLVERSLAADVRWDLQQISRQARRAGALLTGLLRFARPGERRVEPTPLWPVVRQAIDLVSYQFGVDQIDVVTAIDGDIPPVKCDASRLEQVVVNLLSNAIQALRTRPPPRRIEVAATPDGTRVLLSIADNGPGVAEEDRERIFAPFFTTKGEEGTGLGLYVSRQVVREDGGDLWAEYPVEGGTRFVTALLPAERREQQRAPAPVASLRTVLSGVRVLVVDDEPSVRKPLGAFLQRLGAQVIDATDGLDALTKLERYAVDVIVLDIRMPRMDGIELFAELQRARPDLPDRVIFLSGDFRQLEEARLAIPHDRTVAKPADLPALAQLVGQVAKGPPPPSSPAPPPPTA